MIRIQIKIIFVWESINLKVYSPFLGMGSAIFMWADPQVLLAYRYLVYSKNSIDFRK